MRADQQLLREPEDSWRAKRACCAVGIFPWTDPPGATHPPHTHAGRTAHVVLEGEIAVTAVGTTRTYAAGQRFDVRAGQVHAAVAGARGCTYIVGERPA